MIWIINKYGMIVILIQLLLNAICIKGVSVKKDISPLKTIDEERNTDENLYGRVLSKNVSEINSELENEIIPNQGKHHKTIIPSKVINDENIIYGEPSSNFSEKSSNVLITENNLQQLPKTFISQKSTEDPEVSHLLNNRANTRRYGFNQFENKISTVSDYNFFNEFTIDENIENRERNKNIAIETIPVFNLKENVSESSGLKLVKNESSGVNNSEGSQNSTESFDKNHSIHETPKLKLSKKEMEELGIRFSNQPSQHNNTKTMGVVLENNNSNGTGNIYLYPGKDVNITFNDKIKRTLADADTKTSNSSREIESIQLENNSNISQNTETENSGNSVLLSSRKVINFESIRVNISLQSRQDNNTWLLKLHFEDTGEIFEFILNSLQTSAFPRDILIKIENSDKPQNHPLSSVLKDLEIYEGKSENQHSYAIGNIINSTFFGTLMLPNGKIICMEPSEEFQNGNNFTGINFMNYKTFQAHLDTKIQIQHPNNSTTKEIFSEIYYCKFDEESRILCFSNLSTNENDVQDTPLPSNNDPSKTSFPPLDVNLIQNITCSIELISHSSHFVGKHGKNEITALREMIEIAQMSNKVFNQIDLNDDGVQENLNLPIENIVLHSTEVSSDSQDQIKKYIAKFRKRKPQSCMSLIFVHSQENGEPVSYTYDGGVCKSNEIDSELASNIAVLNTALPNQTNGCLFMNSFIFLKTIGNVFAGLHSECNKAFKATSSGDWNNFFSKCEKRNIATYLSSEGSCLPKVENLSRIELKKNETENSLCGNGKVDKGEECDCESIENCKSKSSCCVPPGQKNECHYDRQKGYECEWTDICCTKECKLIPESWKFFCGYGEPSCSSENSFCDGISSKCPADNEATKTFDGQRCWPGLIDNEGTGTCNNGSCNSTICKDAGLLDCKCPSSTGTECRVCCQKSEDQGLCVPAEHHGLKSNNSEFFYRDKGTPCREIISGECDESGQCSAMKLESASQSVLFGKKDYLKQYTFSLTVILCSVIIKILILKLFG